MEIIIDVALINVAISQVLVLLDMCLYKALKLCNINNTLKCYCMVISNFELLR